MTNTLNVGDLGYMRWGEDIVPFAAVKDQIDDGVINLMRLSCSGDLCWSRLGFGDDPEVVSVEGHAQDWYSCYWWILGKKSQ